MAQLPRDNGPTPPGQWPGESLGGPSPAMDFDDSRITQCLGGSLPGDELDLVEMAGDGTLTIRGPSTATTMTAVMITAMMVPMVTAATLSASTTTILTDSHSFDYIRRNIFL